MTEILAQPWAPSARAFYSRVRGCPGFRLAFIDACAWRDFMLEQERWEVIDRVMTIGIEEANLQLRAVDGRRGRLRPKLYRKASLSDGD